MSDLAAALKSEIRRLAKREAKALSGPLRKAVNQLRQQAWALNRVANELRRQIAAAKAPVPTELPVVEPQGITRLGPSRIRALRRRLGLSLPEFGKLLGVHANTVYKWEHGEGQPRAKLRARIIAARTLNKTAAKKLAGK